MGIIEYLQAHRSKLLGSVLLLIIIGFVFLSGYVFFFPLSSFDLRFSTSVQEHHTVFLDRFMTWISWFGFMPVSVIMVVLVSAVFLAFNYKREAIFTLLTLLSGVVSTIIKILINRPRPSQDLVRIVYLVKQQSFPSGHVLFYTVFFGFLIILMGRVKTIPLLIRWVVFILSLSLILLIPISRVYLGAHWFTDVFGGIMLGLLCLYLLGYFYLYKKAVQ